MMKALATVLLAAVIGGCSTHVALLALDKEQSNQQLFTDNYDYEMSLMEAKDYE